MYVIIIYYVVYSKIVIGRKTSRNARSPELKLRTVQTEISN